MNTLFIHQVYGLYRDNKPMNPLFKHSFLKCKSLEHINNSENRKYKYKYKLWNADQCDKLVKKYSPEFDYYFDTRFEIMKVDIIRFLILYDQGGIYLDMDVVLNTYNLNYLFDYPNELYTCYYYYYPTQKDNKRLVDIEVLATINPKNNVIKQYLNYIPTQILEKENMDWYEKCKIRFIFNTTGPNAFRRFLKTIKYEPYHLVTIQLHKEDKDFNNYNPKKYAPTTTYFIVDFLSYYSLSYLKQVHGDKKIDTKYRNNKKKTNVN